MMFSRDELTAAAALVHGHMPATALHLWPTLSLRTGTETWVKHENHAPTGAFKVRGAITYIDWLRRAEPDSRGIVTATRGNHGQAQARAAQAQGLRAVIYVPRGNSVEKNAAMAAFGAELRVAGDDYDTAREAAMAAAQAENLSFVPPFHRELVRGVATYGLEMFLARPDLDTVYVPVGCGSGICGTIAARDALGLKTEIVGVVSTGAQTALLSVRNGRLTPTDKARTFADGIAVRVPVQPAYDVYSTGAARIIAVSDDEIAAAIRAYFVDTHNVAEGAGAAPLAGLLRERDRMTGRRVGVILCGGNIDSAWMHQILAGQTPQP